jgi:hypothetical protein
MSVLDPAAWLTSFETLGGGYVRNSANQLCFGWIALGKTADEHQRLRGLFNTLNTDKALGDAVDALILQRETPAT